MNKIFSFGSVAPQQVEALTRQFGEPDKDGCYHGSGMALGVTIKPSYAANGGVLTVEVLSHPFYVSIETIKSHIKAALDDAAKAEPPAPEDKGPEAPADAPKEPTEQALTLSTQSVEASEHSE